MMKAVELYLFTVDEQLAMRAVQAGITGLVVDWECRAKRERQRQADTEINRHTPEDLARIRSATQARILCRINSFGPQTEQELELALQCGADEVLLPMVRRPFEVETVLRFLNARRPLGILIETEDAVNCAAELAGLPLSRVYVGLNDLSIDRGTSCIFQSLVDGTIDSIRHYFECEFGLAGATLPEKGHPIPARLLIGEIARLGGTFTFLRRSFRADTAGLRLNVYVPRILEAFEEAQNRTPDQVLRDHEMFRDAVLART